jgi:hypothetical protein
MKRGMPLEGSAIERKKSFARSKMVILGISRCFHEMRARQIEHSALAACVKDNRFATDLIGQMSRGQRERHDRDRGHQANQAERSRG